MKTTRHKSSKMIDDYTHDNSLLENNATNMMSTSKSYSNKLDSIFKKYLQFQTAFKLYDKVKTNIKKFL